MSRSKSYDIDQRQLEQEFRSIQKRLHPDFFYRKSKVFNIFAFLVHCANERSLS